MAACGVFNYVLINLRDGNNRLEQTSLTACGSVNTPQKSVQACIQKTNEPCLILSDATTRFSKGKSYKDPFTFSWNFCA